MGPNKQKADMFTAASILNSKKAFYFSIDFFFPPLSLANTLMQFTCTPHFFSIYLSSAQAHFWLSPHVDYITKCVGLQRQRFLCRLSVSSSAWISDLLLVLPCRGVYVVGEVLTFAAAYVGRLAGCWRRRFLIQVNGCRAPGGRPPPRAANYTFPRVLSAIRSLLWQPLHFGDGADRLPVDAPAELTR